MSKKQFDDLRIRAEKLLRQCRQKKLLPTQDITQLIHELTIHQVELEIQNEDLIKTQSELEESRCKYVELYDLAPVGYFSFNEECLITEVNQAGCRLLGLKKQALINRCFSRYIAQEHQTLFSQLKKQAFNSLDLQSCELKMLRWNEPSFFASLECKVIHNEHTDYKQLLAFVTDISARKQAENSLHQQRIKMASIDRVRSINELVYGMAQEQSNALMMMDNYLQGCIRRLESNTFQSDDLLKALRKVATQSRTVSDLIMTRKTITSKSVFHYVHANINTIIKQTITLLTHEILEYPVTIQFTEISNNKLKVKLDIFHLQQAILNLARNAIESMRDSKIQEPKLLIEITEAPEDMIEVTLFDNGPGVANELITEIFKAHYTTKPYGIGLGLTVSRVIIEKHGGQLYALENPSGGACFGFTLPYIKAEAVSA